MIVHEVVEKKDIKDPDVVDILNLPNAKERLP
jgi:hypothetical protein